MAFARTFRRTIRPRTRRSARRPAGASAQGIAPPRYAAEVSDRAPSIREHLERLMPARGRARRLVGWGAAAWAGIGVGVLALALRVALAKVAGVVPYLIV